MGNAGGICPRLAGRGKRGLTAGSLLFKLSSRGATRDLRKRVCQHKNKALPGFTAQYGLNCLVYFEEFREVTFAIEREKQIRPAREKRSRR
jgi:hypothetical protein